MKNDFLKRLSGKPGYYPRVQVTPEMAQELLDELNKSNRPIKPRLVKRYAKEMKDGHWIYAGGTVKISSDMVLQDGQHTLLAIVASGTTQTLNIETGLAPEAFNVMDTGMVRTGGDILAIKGYTSYYLLSSAIKSILNYEQQGGIKNNLSLYVVTNAEVDDFTKRDKDMKLLLNCADFVVKMQYRKKGSFLSPSTWTFIYFLLSKLHMAQATEFVNRLAGGEDISMTNHPAIYLCRERLLTFNEKHLGVLRKGGRAITAVKVQYIFKAWNSWRKKDPAPKLTPSNKQDEFVKPI